jgi:hypothetical protein
LWCRSSPVEDLRRDLKAAPGFSLTNLRDRRNSGKYVALAERTEQAVLRTGWSSVVKGRCSTRGWPSTARSVSSDATCRYHRSRTA